LWWGFGSPPHPKPPKPPTPNPQSPIPNIAIISCKIKKLIFEEK